MRGVYLCALLDNYEAAGSGGSTSQPIHMCLPKSSSTFGLVPLAIASLDPYPAEMAILLKKSTRYTEIIWCVTHEFIL
jgi:hypothetical protein